MLEPTLNKFPIDPATKEGAGLPWGLIAYPLSDLPTFPTYGATKNETTIPEIARCDSCGGYISGLCRVNLQYWQCFLCNKRNILPERYKDAVRSANTKLLQKFPELNEGVCNIHADTTPEAERVLPTAYIFVLDANYDRYVWDKYCNAIYETLKEIQGECVFGVVVYRMGKVHFLDLRSSRGAMRCILHEVEKGWAPRAFPPDQWLRSSLEEGVIEKCGRALAAFKPAPIVADHDRKSALLDALGSSLDMVTAGGYIAARVSLLVSSSSASSLNMNGHESRNGVAKQLVSKIKETIGDNESPVPKIARRAFDFGVIIDVYAQVHASNANEMCLLAKQTGGQLCTYGNACESLAPNLIGNLKQPAIVHGIARFRTCSEMTVSGVYGYTVSPHIELREVYETADQGKRANLALNLDFNTSDGFMSVGSRPAVQCAYRCTLIEVGRLPRRILRIYSAVYQASTSRNVLRKGADAQAISLLLSRSLLQACDMSGPEKGRESLRNWLSDFLAKSARPSDHDKSLQVDSSFAKLPSLRKLPYNVYGLYKSQILDIPDEASYDDIKMRLEWEWFDSHQLCSTFVPQLYSFADENQMKKTIDWPLYEEVQKSEEPIFLLYNGQTIIIYYKKTSSGRNRSTSPSQDTEVFRTQKELEEKSAVPPRVLFCREGAPDERMFTSQLLDDLVSSDLANIASFDEFMQKAIKQARAKLRTGSESI